MAIDTAQGLRPGDRVRFTPEDSPVSYVGEVTEVLDDGLVVSLIPTENDGVTGSFSKIRPEDVEVIV